MKIVVVADTHKDYHTLKKVVDANADADLFIHLGDGQHELVDMQNLYPEKQFIFVLGNSDFGTAKTDRIVSLGGHKIFCTHGHLYGVHFGVKKLVEKAKFNGCEIALHGHTHLFRMQQVEGVYVMNPGSLESPRGKNPPTYGIIVLSDENRIDMSIVAVEK
jgi:putative phosphoesterase